MAKTTMKAGYRITITSWENDADNYNTKTVNGLNEGEARLVVELCSLLRQNSSTNKPGEKFFGNMYHVSPKDREEFGKAVSNVITKHLEAAKSLDLVDGRNEDDGDEDYVDYSLDRIRDYLYDLGLTGGEQYTRVCDEIKVEYLPAVVKFENVTKKFVKW